MSPVRRPASGARRPGPRVGAGRAVRRERAPGYVLKLYVTGLNRASGLAIERVRAVCETHLQGRYELEVVDIYQKPALARDEQILATPTLIKVLPAPLRRYIGNLANVERVLFGLDLQEKR
jgi:circadian clock protein KaiB